MRWQFTANRLRRVIVRLTPFQVLIVEAASVALASFIGALASEWIADALALAAFSRLLVLGGAYVLVGTTAIAALRYIRDLRDEEIGAQALLGTARAFTDTGIIRSFSDAMAVTESMDRGTRAPHDLTWVPYDPLKEVFYLLEALHEISIYAKRIAREKLRMQHAHKGCSGHREQPATSSA